MNPFVWVCSYPKSGNTWVRELLKSYAFHKTGNRPWGTGDDSVYYYRLVSPIDLYELTTQMFIQIRPAAMLHLRMMATQDQDSLYTVVKSHSVNGGHDGIPMFSPMWVDKLIYVHRDPREILPSLADHMGIDHQKAVEFMGDDNSLIGGNAKNMQTVLASWTSHLTSWLENGRVNTYVTSYRQLHNDAGHVLEEVLEFIGLEVDQKAIKLAVSDCEFSKMAEKEQKDGYGDKSDHSKRFFRRGEVGTYAEEVDNVTLARIVKDHREMMIQLGYL